ncbi:MAG TPA: TRAP transporter small permease [Desulfovibrio sp.]|jgi:TRAP-type C4-dicarboxylate transport system permease small subunit|nr:TRAP transporter small permease [Desulfovibrio sp.]
MGIRLMQNKPDLLDRASEIMRVLACVFLVGMALTTGTDVLGRAFRHPLFGSDEVVALLAGLVTAFTLPHAHQSQSHIAVDLVVGRMSPAVRRALAQFTDLLSLALFGVVAWRMFDFALDLERAGVRTMSLGLREYFVVAVVGLGFVVFTLLIGRDVLRRAKGRI